MNPVLMAAEEILAQHSDCVIHYRLEHAIFHRKESDPILQNAKQTLWNCPQVFALRHEQHEDGS